MSLHLPHSPSNKTFNHVVFLLEVKEDSLASLCVSSEENFASSCSNCKSKKKRQRRLLHREGGEQDC